MEAYAGYYIEKKKLKESSSGGAASAISEGFIKDKGIVYAASYSDNFYSATYGCAEKEDDLKKFKGSKYVYVSKKIEKNGETVSVYKDAVSKVKQGKKVLFIGLGCDIAAIKAYAKNELADENNLFTIELLCDGVTNEIVHTEYVSNIERLYGSKVTAFHVRYKEEGWVPPYIYAEFENGKKHIYPFYESDYAFAFFNYKRKMCYNCQFKNHPGDVLLADFWGCNPGMKEYNKNGVSLICVQSEKGKILLSHLFREDFFVKRIDAEYALFHNPRYFNSHEKYDKWDIFDHLIRKEGLREAVKTCAGIYMPERFRRKKFSEIVLWGMGNCFQKYISSIREMVSISYIVDSNEKKWGQEAGKGLVCKSPDVLKGKEDILVLIMIENISAAFQVANELLDMGIITFDYVHNWLCYTC